MNRPVRATHTHDLVEPIGWSGLGTTEVFLRTIGGHPTDRSLTKNRPLITVSEGGRWSGHNGTRLLAVYGVPGID